MKKLLALVLLPPLIFTSFLYSDSMDNAEEAYSSGDFELAVEIWQKYAVQGNATAQNNLGMALRDGKGIYQNFKEAANLFILSAESGNQYAQSNIGLMYLDGLGVEKNNNKAAKYFKLSADQGNASAQTTLGYMHHLGLGMSISFPDAINLYKSAANQGYSIAQRNLGYIYKTGNKEGKFKDLTYSLMWFMLAATDGDEIGKNQADILMVEVSEKDFLSAVSLVEQCFVNKFNDC